MPIRRTDSKYNSDYMSRRCDKQLEDLEENITAVYANATNDILADYNKWSSHYEANYNYMLAKLDAGEITEQQFKDWCDRRMFDDKLYSQTVSSITDVLVNSDIAAMSLVNSELPSVIAQSYNFVQSLGFAAADEAGLSVGTFQIYNLRTVQSLIKDNPDIMKYVNSEKDYTWNKDRVNNAIKHGILNGDSIPKTANRLKEVSNMDKNAAIRNARTGMTAAENLGRNEGFKDIKEKGVPCKLQWSSTHDGRTRDTHILLDGTYQDENGLFGVGIIDKPLEYPGDPAGDPEEIYNCRCRASLRLQGIDHSQDGQMYEKFMKENYPEDWDQVKKTIDEKEAAFNEKAQGAAERVEERRQKASETQEPSEKPDAKINEFAYQEKARLDELSGGKLGAALNKTGFYDKQELVDAMKAGTLDDYKNDYINILVDNGDLTIKGDKTNENDTGEIEKNPRNTMVDDITEKALKSGMTNEEINKMFDEAETYFSSAWDKADSDYVDKFIELTPTFDGVIQRGLHFDSPEELDLFMSGVEKGSVIGMNGKNSSWTSSNEVARRYAHMGDENVNSVMLICDKNVTASAVCKYSHYSDESEVLALSDAKWTVTRTEIITQDNGVKKAVVHVIERTNPV